VRLACYLVAGIVSVGLHGAGDAERQAAGRFTAIEREFESLRQRHSIPGMSMAIVENGTIAWENAAGFANVANGVPARPETPYRIASLTKTFASTLLLQCVESGRLDLDAPIGQFSSAIPEPDVTVRHVLTHTSAAPPGRAYQYNGNRFSALTPVIEKCAGLPYRRALAAIILDPLEMTDSVPGQDLERPSPAVRDLFDEATLARYQRVIARLAMPYTNDTSGAPLPADYPPRGISASAGLIATVRDLAKYDAAIDRNVFVSASTQNLAWTPFSADPKQYHARPSSTSPYPYGLGWFVQHHRGQLLVWHYGSWPQFSALYLKIPARRRTLIVLANSGGLSSPFQLGRGDVLRSPFAAAFIDSFGR
jgi:CubicO group peptidase (beta-lactamase class C family)